jgi:hypothetical protein
MTAAGADANGGVCLDLANVNSQPLVPIAMQEVVGAVIKVNGEAIWSPSTLEMERINAIPLCSGAWTDSL